MLTRIIDSTADHFMSSEQPVWSTRTHSVDVTHGRNEENMLLQVIFRKNLEPWFANAPSAGEAYPGSFIIR